MHSSGSPQAGSVYDQAKHDEHTLRMGSLWVLTGPSNSCQPSSWQSERSPFALANVQHLLTLIVAAPSESFLHVLHTCVLPSVPFRQVLRVWAAIV